MKTGKSILYGIFCLILGIFCFGYGVYNLIHYAPFFFKGETTDMNQLIANGEDLPLDTYMTFTTNSVLGNYAETKHTYGFIPIGKDEHYIVYLDDNTFMSVTVKGSTRVKQLDKIAEETWSSEDYYANSYITLVGRIKSFSGGEIHGYYMDAFSQMGLDTSASDNPVRHLSLDATETRGSQWLWEILFFVVGGLIAIGGLSSLGILNLGDKTIASPAANPIDAQSSAFSDPFASDTQSSAYSDPFARDNRSSTSSYDYDSSADDDSRKSDPLRTGYDDMMEDINNNDKNNGSSGSSGLKLKL